MRHLATLLASIGTAAAMTCNGHESLCGRKYSEVHWAGSHNAPFVGVGPATNQHVDVVDQLDLGIRFLTGQTQEHDGEVRMCHTACEILDSGSLEGFLGDVAEWMAGNGGEVVTLLLTNIDAAPIEEFAEAFERTGLDELVFRPERRLGRGDWPTLGQMVESDKRLVVFMDYHADTNKVPYILPEFDYIWEDEFGETDRRFPSCDPHRPSSADTSKLMGLANHVLNVDVLEPFDFLRDLGIGGDEGVLIPAPWEARWTNSERSVMKHLQNCRSGHGRYPNFFLLDFVHIGDAVGVQNELNGVPRN